MSILRHLFEQRANPKQVQDELSRRRLLTTFAGQSVTLNSAMRHAAVWAAVNFIAETISRLPVNEYRWRDGKKMQLSRSSIITDPNPLVSATNFRRQVVISMLYRGNAWGIVLERDDLLYPTQMEIVHPDEVAIRRKGKLGRLLVRWNGVELSPDEYWHVPAYVNPGSPIGLSPIAYAAQTIGLGLAVTEFGARWFGDGAHPSGLLVTPEPIDKTQADVAKQRWIESIHGRREPAVLGGGWKYEKIQIAPEESQFLETLNANGALIATIFGLRPEDIGFKSGDSQTYANVEQRQIERLVYPIHQWVVLLEEHMSRLLPRGRFVKFNTDASVRTDLKTRTEVQALRLRAGMRSVNEERILDDEDPIGPEGDRYNWPPFNTSTPRSR